MSPLVFSDVLRSREWWGCGEVASLCDRLDIAVAVELGAVVRSDGADGEWRGSDEVEGRAVELGYGAGRELPDHEVPGGALNEGDDAGAPLSQNGIDLPVSDLGAFLDRRWPLGAASLPGETTSGIVCTVALAALLASLAKEGLPRAAVALVAPNVATDGLMADAKSPISLEPS